MLSELTPCSDWVHDRYEEDRFERHRRVPDDIDRATRPSRPEECVVLLHQHINPEF